MDKKILVIWQFIPEEVRCYLFEEDKLTEFEREAIKSAHNGYVNMDCGNSGEAEWLSDFLESHGDNLVHDEKSPINIVGDVTVIVAGFYL